MMRLLHELRSDGLCRDARTITPVRDYAFSSLNMHILCVFSSAPHFERVSLSLTFVAFARNLSFEPANSTRSTWERIDQSPSNSLSIRSTTSYTLPTSLFTHLRLNITTSSSSLSSLQPCNLVDDTIESTRKTSLLSRIARTKETGLLDVTL